jgi:hypothetical protein
MKWSARFSEWLLRFASSQKNIDWVAKWVGGTVAVLALAMVFALVVALILK